MFCHHPQNKLSQTSQNVGECHKLRTSEKFKQEWKDFLEASTGQSPCAAFVQHVTHKLFKYLIKSEHPTTTGVGDIMETSLIHQCLYHMWRKMLSDTLLVMCAGSYMNICVSPATLLVEKMK